MTYCIGGILLQWWPQCTPCLHLALPPSWTWVSWQRTREWSSCGCWKLTKSSGKCRKSKWGDGVQYPGLLLLEEKCLVSRLFFFSIRKSLILFSVLCSVCCLLYGIRTIFVTASDKCWQGMGMRLEGAWVSGCVQQGLGMRLVSFGWAPQAKGHWIRFPASLVPRPLAKKNKTRPGYEANFQQEPTFPIPSISPP